MYLMSVMAWSWVSVVYLTSMVQLTSGQESVGASNTTFYWRTSEWSGCEFRAPGACCQCLRRRNVSCVWRDGSTEEVPPFYCRKLLPSQPADEEPCSPCIQPCVVSMWGQWSACTHTCGHLGSRHRRRTVLLAPSDGLDSPLGLEDECGPLVDFQHCQDLPECVDPRPKYKWKVGPWTSCRKVNTSKSCGPGQRVRQVLCMETDGGRVANDFCNYFVGDDMPESSESCILPCDCRVGGWSDWGPCSVTCHRPNTMQRPLQSRTRSVIRPQQNMGVDCPALIDIRQCDVGELRLCTRYVWHVGEWSECVMPGVEEEDPESCGSGQQNRPVYCINIGDPARTPAEDLQCLHDSSRQVNGSIELKPVSARACKVPCPRSCQLGEWENWSGCTQSCGSGGVRIRTKPILVEATEGGDECSERYETKPCDPVACSWWHTGRWSTCFLEANGGEECGLGKKVRNVYCLSSLDEVLDDSDCGNSTEPPAELTCHVPCQDECVVSDWSEWGACSATCGPQGGLQHRTRTAHGIRDSDRPCLPQSELEQSRICNQRPCKTYLWQVSSWSECRPLEDANSTTCGNDTFLPGTQTREAHCEMDPGYQVNETYCYLNLMPVLEHDCNAPCPQDCELSDWSDWSQCSHTCGRHSHKVRLRYIIKLSLHGGRACPDNKNGVVMQKKQCKRVSDCYTFKWLPGKWSKCQTEQGCGTGIQARSVTCVRSDFKKVRDNHCLEHVTGQSPALERECFVPCRGDCELSAWSGFTLCSQSCGNKPGIQTRTRHLLHLDPHIQVSQQCPEINPNDLLHTLTCGAISCPKYRWTTGPWGSCIVHKSHSRDLSFHCGDGVQRRHVLCVRDDDVHVSPHLCDAIGPMPKRHLPCSIACPVDCDVTEWTAWTNCSAQCGTGVQSHERQVVVSPSERGRKCPHLVETRTCSLIDCEEFDWVISDWGDCQPTYGLPCGRGTRYRSVRCPAGPQYEHSCQEREPKPPIKEPCDVPCFGDCRVGEWSSFSVCDCKVPNATKVRTRIIEKQRLPSGEQCPPLEEERLCGCHSYQVLLGDWTSCQIRSTSGNQCGRGKRERVVNCIRDDGQQMALSRCDTSDIVLSESCELECPVDCELSRLTHWSKCGSECGLEAVKSRWQSPMTRPNKQGRQCPPEDALVQNTTCHSSPCFAYKWSRSRWSKCSVEELSCGIGTRWRKLECHRSDGTTVEHKFCLLNVVSSNDLPVSMTSLSHEVLSDLDLEVEQTCGIGCPGDCLVSEWSVFGPCFQRCDGVNESAVQIRTRSILQPSLGGKLCPEDLVQSRFCEVEEERVCPVFQWETSRWNEDGARNVYCQLQGSMEVEGGCTAVERPSHHRQCPVTCGQFASCVEGRCLCKQGFVGDGQVCLPTYGCELHTHCIANQTLCNIYNKECLCEDGMLPTEDLQCPIAAVENRGKMSGMSTLFLYILIGSLCALMLVVILCVLFMARRKSKKKGKLDLYAPNLAKIENLDNHRRNNELNSGSDAPLLQKYNINSKNLADQPSKGPRYTSNLRSFADQSHGKEQPLLNGTLKSSNKRLLLLGDDKDHDYVPMYGTTPDRSMEPLPPPPTFRSHSCDDPLPPLPPPPMRVSPRVYEPLPPPPTQEEPVPKTTVVHVPSRTSPPRTDGPRLSTFKPDSPYPSSISSSSSTSSSSARSSVSDLSGGNSSGRNSIPNSSDPDTRTNTYENTPGQQKAPVTPPKKQSPPPFMPAVSQPPQLRSFKPHSNRGSATPPTDRSGQCTPGGSGSASPGSSPSREVRPPGQLLDYCDELIAELQDMAKS